MGSFDECPGFGATVPLLVFSLSLTHSVSRGGFRASIPAVGELGLCFQMLGPSELAVPVEKLEMPRFRKHTLPKESHAAHYNILGWKPGRTDASAGSLHRHPRLHSRQLHAASSGQRRTSVQAFVCCARSACSPAAFPGCRQQTSSANVGRAQRMKSMNSKPGTSCMKPGTSYMKPGTSCKSAATTTTRRQKWSSKLTSMCKHATPMFHAEPETHRQARPAATA